MCGICGVVALNSRPVDISSTKSMVDVIAHRGPDDAGYLFAQTGTQHPKGYSFHQAFTEQAFSSVTPMLPVIDSEHGQYELGKFSWNLFLGHRRLSIIDTSPAGHQPMSGISQNQWIVYNGEVYNFKTIKKELSSIGYTFQTETDTEVIIYSYLEWGIECINKFNGMFAFALWDKVKNKFFLVRDRYGIKPLYYTVTDTGKLVFGSEVKSILEYKDYSIDIDHEVLLEYFTFQNIFTDKTLYKDIKLLPAGNYIEIDTSKQPRRNPVTYTEYWDFNFQQPEVIKDEREYQEELNRLFQQAVKRQLVSDVEVGSYLSGGMDSGSITAIASKEIPSLKTFTVGFDLHSASGLELGFDEREKSEYMSYLFKTEHYEMVLKSGDMERCLPEFAWHLEEPRVGQSYPNYYAAKLAGNFVKVVLSGAGGDELFGGYPWRYYRAVVNNNFEDYVDKYYQFWQRLISNKEIQEVFSPIWNKVKDVWTRDIFRDVFRCPISNLTTPEDYVNHSLYFEAKTFLHGLLVVEDKLSMAHSLETRVPFLDNDLVDFAQRVPVQFKLGNLENIVRINENETGSKANKYYQKTKDGKLILRKAMNQHIPLSITNAVKQGFSSPDDSWFKGESIDYVKDKLENSNAEIYRYFNKNAIGKLINEHLEGRQNRRLLIWSLLNVEYWCHTFL